ncbi:tryptophan synthase subunit beta like protein [Wenzhouxiangella limi]|nr:tryptophan synthase subunit beta like protein [Wenzhouxiangella limi]
MDEQIGEDDPDLQEFIGSLSTKSKANEDEVEKLRSSDVELARVVEDIINLLTDKGVIQFTDLPEAAQQKLLQRRILRQHIQRLDLVDEDQDQLMP